jgi:hypothetical protein
MERGDVSAGSFGFRILDDKWTTDADGGVLRELREVQLFDVSVVTYPAYPETNGSVALRSLVGGPLHFEQLAPAFIRQRAGQPLADAERSAVQAAISSLQDMIAEPAPATPDVHWRLNLAKRRLALV